MENWLIKHFDVQKGMYFDVMAHEGNYYYFGSDLISDSIWNYGFVKSLDVDALTKFDMFCRSIGKYPNIYVPHEKHFDDSILVNNGYERPENEDGSLSTETWMRFTEKKYHLKATCHVCEVSSSREIEDFISVFLSAYGGEKTPEKPYGELPVEYTEALKRSFQKDKFHHFVCYNTEGVPVSVASLCMEGDFGGLYNIGTTPLYERKGYGLAVTDACINKWFELHGKELFLQTETGTGIDSWYNRMGFDILFYGAIYEKH